MKDFISELRSRDMLYDLMPGTEQLLQASPVVAYIGIDPTAPSLHIGNLATLMLLEHFQQAGHKPVVLLGGATAMVGDPSFKARERKLLDRGTLEHNLDCIHKQVVGLLAGGGKCGVQVLNNYEWLREVDMLSFLRDVGKYITINYMMSKDAIKTRLGDGISYTEFAYPLLQAYDFYYLYKNHGVKLQMGGSDQWGNITTGAELVRKKEGGVVFGLTCPLMTKADGSKFGKTEGGNVWLDAKLTSAYEFYQFWLNCSDQEAPVLMKRLTLVDLEIIEELVRAHRVAPEKRLLQKELARVMTTKVHSHEAYLQARQASEVLFGKGPMDLQNLEESTFLEALSGVLELYLNREEVVDGTTVVDLLCALTEGKIFSSKRAAREMIEAGGVRINKVRVTCSEQVAGFDWLWDRYLLVQKGKKNYYIVKLSN